jgi:predicted ATPase
LPAAALGEAGRLLDPTSGTPEPDSGLAAADARFRLHDGIGRVLSVLATDRPVVLVLDDLHWADDQSLAVLDSVSRGLAADRVLIAGAYRDAEAPPALLGLTAGQHLPLTGLNLPEARALVGSLPGSSLSPELTEQVWRRSDGNPFFVRELVRLVQAQGRLAGRLPAGVIETVRRRMARLPSESARLLDWAAVAGRDIDLALLVAAGAVADESAAADLLVPARRAGIVTDDPPRLSHDLFRDAILDGQSAPVTATINLAIGLALQRLSTPQDPSRIAAHLLSAGPQARADATRYCILAARAATAGLGHADACRHYLHALDRLDVGDPGHVEVQL